MPVRFSSDFFPFIVANFLVISVFFGCSKREGCIDPNAANYVYEAGRDDGTCMYDLSFWMNTDRHGRVSIFVDGSYEGILDCYWVSRSPVCGVDDAGNNRAQCVLNVARPPGNHSVKLVAQDGTTWEKNYNLGENCLSILIEGV